MNVDTDYTNSMIGLYRALVDSALAPVLIPEIIRNGETTRLHWKTYDLYGDGGHADSIGKKEARGIIEKRYCLWK